MTLNRRWMCFYIWLYGINKVRYGLAEISFNFYTNKMHGCKLRRCKIALLFVHIHMCAYCMGMAMLLAMARF